MKKRKTLGKSIVIRFILFITVLCVVLSVGNYFGYRSALYQRYEDYITDLLHYVASEMDIDDMEECLQTGEKSEKYEQTQVLFDTIKDTHDIDYLYVIIPQNDGPVDNIMNVIAGMSTYEKQYVPENQVTLGGLTGTDYTAETAAKYYNCRDSRQEISFFEEWADRWGSEYTGILSLYDSQGNYFAELCIDVSTNKIQTVIRNHVLVNVLIVVAIGVLFAVIFLAWIRKSVVKPVQIIEQKVVDLANRSHDQTNPDALVLENPQIRTRNELESLSDAVVKLTEDMRQYLINALAARDDAEAAEKKANEMSEQATRDALTGIRNRRAYEAEVKKVEWRIQTEGFHDFGVAMVDLNFLKRINDTFGHEKGNQAIIKICTITCKTFSHSPVFRIGGDEFVVILENEDFEKVEERMAEFERILQKLKEDETLESWEKVSAAIGWSKFDPDIDRNVDNVFKRADHNMYENKKEMKAVRTE